MKLSSFTHSLPAAGHMSGGSVTNGFKFTGKETGYTGNSVFFPAEDCRSDAGVANYWSATADGSSNAWEMKLHYEDSVYDWLSKWDSRDPNFPYFVRPVLKN